MTFTLVLTASIVAVSTSHVVMEETYSDENAGRKSMQIWKSKIEGSRESDRIIGEYESSYMQLVRNNIVGQENRLSWFETIQATSNARGMPSVKYNVSSQKKLNANNSFSDIDVFRTSMTLDIQMAHEGDLFAMFNNLEKKAKGLFSVDKCSISQVGEIDPSNNENRMEAYCELSWYTFKSSEKSSVKRK